MNDGTNARLDRFLEFGKSKTPLPWWDPSALVKDGIITMSNNNKYDNIVNTSCQHEE